MAYLDGNQNVPSECLKLAADVLMGQELIPWKAEWKDGIDGMDALTEQNIYRAVINSAFEKNRPKLMIFPKRRVFTLMGLLMLTRSVRLAYINLLASREHVPRNRVMYMQSFDETIINEPYRKILDPAFISIVKKRFGSMLNIDRDSFPVSIIHFIMQYACRLATHMSKLERI